jgi:CHRD domain
MRRAALVLTVFALAALAQPQEKFKARLHPVPIDPSMRAEITGGGALEAVLDGHKLSLTGSFAGMQSPATIAQIHEGAVTGVPGPAIRDLTISKATSGSITGTFQLTGDQVEMLRKGRLYVQIHSEKAPDGNLWGWLLR